MMARRIPTCIALALAVVSGTAAQTSDPDTHAAAAAELLEVMHVEKSATDIIGIMLKLQLESDPGMAQYEDVLRAFLSKFMAWDEVRPLYVRVYQEVFSEKELRELVAFYRTPTGQRFINSTPAIMNKCAEVARTRLNEHRDELKAAIEKRAQELKPAGTP